MVSPKIGEVSLISLLPDQPKALIILGHGAGANMEHRFMKGLSEHLAQVGLASLRFNFPYMENKTGRPDRPPVAHETIRAVCDHADSALPNLLKILAGKSFGGRMSSQTMAMYRLPSIAALVFYGFPLHAPAKPGIDRADHLFEVTVPMLFLQGDRDNLARLELLEPLLQRLPLAHLQIFAGADHSFHYLKKYSIGEELSLELLAQATLDFILRLQ